MTSKFIIATTDHYTGYFKFGLVDLHSKLKNKNESVYGGGTFEIDKKKKILKLSGKSEDFGLPIFNGWDKLKISDDWRGFKITYTYPYGYNHDNEVIDLTNKLEYDEDL